MFMSSLPEGLEKKIRKRHNMILADIEGRKETRANLIAGLKIKVHPGVFPPFPDSVEFANIILSLGNLGGVLDMGTGSGILGMAASGNARSVLSVDINSKAVRCANENARINNICNFRAACSDLFSNVSGRFDTIIFNPPFRYFKPKNMLDRAMTDHNYMVLGRFFREAAKHLKPKGVIYLAFSNSGDIKHLKMLIKKHGFRARMIKRIEATDFVEDFRIYYFFFKITR